MSIRNRFAIVLVVVGALLSGGVAHAADYVVQIGADTESGKDASSWICWFDHTCRGELKELGLQVDINVRRALLRIARLRLHGRSPGCCTFEHGRAETAIDLHDTFHHEPIFKGEKAGDGMIVENARVGSLYLRFRLLSPDRRDDRRGLDQPI